MLGALAAVEGSLDRVMVWPAGEHFVSDFSHHPYLGVFGDKVRSSSPARTPSAAIGTMFCDAPGRLPMRIDRDRQSSQALAPHRSL